MATTDLIARFILETLDASDGLAELQRATLAEKFSCVPSQINYVLSTRFSPERGYLVESRRGGGGYIRIRRVVLSPSDLLMSTIRRVGSELDYATASALVSNLLDTGMIDKTTADILLSAVSDAALRPLAREDREILRASIFKQMLIHLMGSERSCSA